MRATGAQHANLDPEPALAIRAVESPRAESVAMAAPVQRVPRAIGQPALRRTRPATERRRLVIDLQRIAGNAATSRIVRDGRKADEEEEEVPETTETAPEPEPEPEPQPEPETVQAGSEEAEEQSIAENEPEEVAEEEESGGGEQIEGVSGTESEGEAGGTQELAGGEEAGGGEAIEPSEETSGTEMSGTLEPIEGEEQSHGHGCDVADDGDSPRLPIRTNFTIDSSAAQAAIAAGFGRDDSVNSTLTMTSSTKKGGVTVSAKAFGSEVVSFSFDNIAYTTESGVVKLSATIKVDCKWDVTSRGRTNVSGPGDAAVTRAQWAKIVSDLTPRADGRATREKFWAQDLTEKHEKFHATDDIDRATLFMPSAKTLADSKTVTIGPSLDTQLRAVMTAVRDAIKADSWTYYNSVGIGGEGRAYADGKSSYQARADTVKAKAVSEGWTT